VLTEHRRKRKVYAAALSSTKPLNKVLYTTPSGVIDLKVGSRIIYSYDSRIIFGRCICSSNSKNNNNNTAPLIQFGLFPRRFFTQGPGSITITIPDWDGPAQLTVYNFNFSGTPPYNQGTPIASLNIPYLRVLLPYSLTFPIVSGNYYTFFYEHRIGPYPYYYLVQQLF